MAKKITGVNYRPTTTEIITSDRLNTLRKAGMVPNGVTFHQHFTINLETATYILQNHNPNNREINWSDVEKYVRLMRNEKWNKQIDDAITFDWEGNLCNGQHRLLAIVETGLSQEFLLRFGVDPIIKFTEGTNRIKSGADMLAMLGNTEYVRDRSAIARMLFAFLYDQHTPQSYSRKVKASNVDLGEMEEQFGKAIFRSAQVARSCKINDIAIVSNAAFVHFLISQTEHAEKADQFIHDMASGINMAADDPRLVIRNRLISKPEFRSQKKRDECIGMLIKAWNGWIDGKSMTTKERSVTSIPRVSGLTTIGRHKLYVNP